MPEASVLYHDFPRVSNSVGEREREAEGVREEPEEAGREAVEEEEKLFNTLIKDLCEPLLAVAGIANMSQKMTKSPVNFESWDNDKALHSMN